MDIDNIKKKLFKEHGIEWQEIHTDIVKYTVDEILKGLKRGK